MPGWTRALAGCVLASAPLLAAAAAPEDALALRGEALYVGSARLASGGAPCLACHAIAGHGLARAASFGPDLSRVYEGFGPDALDVALEEIPFASMQPVYKGHAIAADERAALVAFLRQAGTKAPPAAGRGLAACVAGAMAAFLGAFVALGRRGAARKGRAAAKRGTP
ncbi:MAG TPA: hypothetical protein VFP65_06555 [Anaeromyxobacteraceae bacterium]|nr:hypothetical protein [Anaeromyxobacteraceae bacterium]